MPSTAPLLRAAALGLTMLLALPAVTAADATGRSATSSNGSVAGRVQNVATGQYLNNVRVTVKDTELVAFTDQTGSFRLSGVPSGPAVLEVFFTGLDVQRIPVTVRAGETLSQDVNLTSATRYGTDASGTVKLDSFVVATSRETDGAAIAVNEQRFSPNIKNVIAADAMGDVMDGNVGEFLKFMPGITAEYDRDSGGSVSSVSVRGFPTNMAVVSGDGLQMASTGNTVGTSRVFQFTQVSINNISRLEVTKVPTPANPADSMAGSIDMVSKSSFERKSAQLRYTFGVSGNPKTMSLRRVPHITDEREYKTLPSFTFDYTLPVTKTFGIVLTGQSQNRFIEMQWVPRTFNANAAGTGASFARPYLQSFQLLGVPRRNERNAAGIKADWRVTTNGVLSFNVERTRWVSERANVAITFNAGTNAVPLPATGVPLTFGDDFTSGATGRGTVNLANAGAGVHLPLETRAASVRYRHDDGNWRIVAAAGGSTSAGGYNDIRYGRFRTLDIVNRVPVRVSFANIDDVRPQSIQVFDNTGREFDVNNFDNYQLNGSTSQERMVKDRLTNAKLDRAQEPAGAVVSRRDPGRRIAAVAGARRAAPQHHVDLQRPGRQSGHAGRAHAVSDGQLRQPGGELRFPQHAVGLDLQGLAGLRVESRVVWPDPGPADGPGAVPPEQLRMAAGGGDRRLRPRRARALPQPAQGAGGRALRKNRGEGPGRPL